MPKSGRGPALFDLLGDGPAEESGRQTTPTWQERVRDRGEGSAAGQAREDGDQQLDSGGGDEPIPAEGSASVRFLELDGECLRVSFTTKTAAIAIFASLVVLVGAFELGRSSGEATGRRLGYELGKASYAAEAMDSIEAARSRPPATHLVEDLLVGSGDAIEVVGEPSTEIGGTSEQAPWVKGNTYIVVQEFLPGAQDDVRRARDFLSENGIETALIELPGGSMQLLTTQGYNRQAPMQRRLADELLQKVHAVGERYYASGGGYRLKGYFKTLTGDTW